jgi:hypothetical protein
MARRDGVIRTAKVCVCGLVLLGCASRRGYFILMCVPLGDPILSYPILSYPKSLGP